MTINLDDMRLFAAVAARRSFTAAARDLLIPKQTLSRRIAELERELGVALMQRTTRQLHLTEAGAAYARRCGDVVRIAAEARCAVGASGEAPSGTLRVTADPVFGEAFLGSLLVAYARAWPDVRIDVVLTRRRVDLEEEGFDVAFRVGAADATSQTAKSLGPARIRYCASPSYVEERGMPRKPRDLADHDAVVVAEPGAAARWPFRGRKGLVLTPVKGRLTFTSFSLAHGAVVAGLGVGLFPEFACEADLRGGRLVPVMQDDFVDVGAIWVLHAMRTASTARVRAFLSMAERHFSKSPRRVPAR